MTWARQYRELGRPLPPELKVEYWQLERSETFHVNKKSLQKPPILVEVSEFKCYRDFLRSFYLRQKNLRPSYSYSVWAHSLGLKSSSTLIMIVNGKRHPGPELIKTLCRFFKLNSTQSKYFRELVDYAKFVDKRTPAQQEDHSAPPKQQLPHFRDPRFGMQLLRSSATAPRREWYLFAIRELSRLKDFTASPSWIRSQLDFEILTDEQIQNALDSLIQLGLIRQNRNGKWSYGPGHVATGDDEVDFDLRSFHNTMLAIAQKKSETTELWEREISGGCFAISSKNMPLAKELIRKFQRDLCEVMEKDDPDSVYQLEVAFFPLTQSKKNTSQTEGVPI